jgi:hypothetical protein
MTLALTSLHFQDQVIDKMQQTKEFLLEKRDYVISSFSDSPDDGLGDSIARQSSQERCKLDSAVLLLIYQPDDSGSNVFALSTVNKDSLRLSSSISLSSSSSSSSASSSDSPPSSSSASAL